MVESKSVLTPDGHGSGTRKLYIGIVFGGVSPEHEVSVITALQAAEVLDRTKYAPIPLYLAKDGGWYTGEKLLDIESYGDMKRLFTSAEQVQLVPDGNGTLLVRSVRASGMFRRVFQEWRLDALFLGLHGGAGESGGMQGLCELLDVPYTGSGVLGSALAMDKARSREFCQNRGIPVVSSLTVREEQWAGNEEEWIDRALDKIGLPVVVKPVSLGSSIGISRVETREELDAAVEEAFRYDVAVAMECAVPNLREINCSVLGDEDRAEPSVLEEPLSDAGILSYRDKYMRGSSSSKSAPTGAKSASAGMASLDRQIPADVSESFRNEIQSMAVKIFQMLGCSGVARIDFLIDGETGKVYFNEINTIPGSLSYYLWEPTGLAFPDLVQRLIDLAFKMYRDRKTRIRSYDVNLLEEKSLRGFKNAK